ncbi:MAG: FHA domain-containing protein [Thermoanaerobaculia bacterium]
MIVECDHCHARYRYDEDRFAGKASKKLRCSRCQTIFEVFNTRAYEAQPPVRPPLQPDETRIRRTGDAEREEAKRKDRVSAAESRKPAGELKLPPDVKLSLAVIAGPDAGKMFQIDRPRVVIGREEVDFVLDDPEISRQHAALEVRGDQVSLLDLGSSNGTLVGEDQISEVTLENQGEFTVGGSTLMLIVTPAG